MIFLTTYKEAINKTVKEVRECQEDYFDDPIEVTLIIFTDDTALLIRKEMCDYCSSGIIDLTDQCLTLKVREALGL